MADFWLEDSKFKLQGVPDNLKLSQLDNLLFEALISTGHVENCALIDKKDLQVQAHSSGYKVNKNQLGGLIDGFKNSVGLRREGLLFDNIDYKCVRADKYSIYATSLDDQENHDTPVKEEGGGVGKGGLIAVRTNTFVLVAKYKASMYPAVCIEAVEKLAEYLREKGR